MGRKLTPAQRAERKALKRLIAKIRRTNKYAHWKDKALRRDVKSYPKIPKGVQVHHETEITKLIIKYNIKTVKEALRCKELWEAESICLKRGEHFIFTKLGRYKYLTKGFRKLLVSWLENTKVDRLDANKKRRKR